MDTKENSDFSESRWFGTYVLDEKGNPVPEPDTKAWSLWMANHPRHLALTEFVGGTVSTIFLGIDLSIGSMLMDDPLGYVPILWKTMVFGGALDQSMWRYHSREEALEGHRLAAEQCTQMIKN